jgi:hypothetical protein
MSIHAETAFETRPFGRLSDLLRSAFSSSQLEADWVETPQATRQERLLHAARTACAGTLEW